MTEATALLDLPAETLVVLVSGYLAYRLAYLGRDSGHRPTDVVFIVLAFGLVAKAVVALSLIDAVYAQAGAGATSAMVVAGLWRWRGMEWWFRLLRRTGISMADSHPTALQSVVRRESIRVHQVVVQRRNGTDLMCNDASLFEDAATGPFWLGEDGSVALYVTHVRTAGSDEWTEQRDVRHETGDLITIVPADDVAMVELRTTR